MAEDRKKIIVNEIHYWKQSKLLPEKYCNFLLALYTEGEDSTDSRNSLFQGKIWNITYYFLNFLMLPFSFVVIYFTENDVILQTVLLTVFVLLSLLQLWWIYKQNGMIHIPLNVTLLLVFLLTTTVASTYFENVYVFLVSLLNIAGWYFIGYRSNIFYLKIISLILALGLILYMLF
ncbi:hypothetical protein SAMN05421687_10194 [Salimicrobium flavidum]|uniref:Uncharacterized protein n=1 Tax=Salimicrobium flavidum TaxID=570947 RepID=A0A1N7IIF8_9BACI|nr:hypothetical protein SAMN05421687_10194 [Salimicrobium flavidum]